MSQEKIFFSQNPSENNSNGKPLRNNDGKTPYGCLRTKAQGIYKTKLGRDMGLDGSSSTCCGLPEFEKENMIGFDQESGENQVVSDIV